jgi:hypothetical protein
MSMKRRNLIPYTLVAVTMLILMLPNTYAQTAVSGLSQDEVAKATNTPDKTPATNAPVFADYRGVRIGMSAEEVRAKLKDLNKEDTQDFISSDKESAQIYYDENKIVRAISIDYFNSNSNTPLPAAILGVALQAKPDGSMYQLVRYPEAGYWVSYCRTAGDKAIVTITMQRM